MAMQDDRSGRRWSVVKAHIPMIKHDITTSTLTPYPLSVIIFAGIGRTGEEMEVDEQEEILQFNKIFGLQSNLRYIYDEQQRNQ